jgi:hypothetical protein
MSTTLLAMAALIGSLAPAAKPEFRVQSDYGRALQLAASENKPMAVLIGKGDVFAKLTGEAGLSSEAKKLLSEKYVCLSVNVDTDAGKSLADQFRLTDGLVISSAGGSHQALRQVGTVTPSDLAKHTAAYANTTGTPTTTVTVGAPVATSTSNYSPTYQPAYQPTYQPSYQPSYQPVYYPNTVVPSGYAFPSYSSFGACYGRT